MEDGKTHHSWVRLPQVIILRSWAECSGKIPTKSHSRTSHVRHLRRVELAITVAGSLEALVGAGHGTLGLTALGRTIRVGIEQVVLTQLDTQGFQVESTDYAGKLVPRNDFVDEVEDGDEQAIGEAWLVAGPNVLCRHAGVW